MLIPLMARLESAPEMLSQVICDFATAKRKGLKTQDTAVRYKKFWQYHS